jgi:protoporphyrinogen oxidase
VDVEFLVVGAGPTGLGAAHNLRRRGVGFLMVDSDRRPGGLAKSVVDEQGFTWDMGGHVQFSHYELFDRFMDHALGHEGWIRHTRQSWIWVAGRFVPYPLQNNIHRLPAAEQAACIDGLRQLVGANHSKAEDFQKWIDSNFGDGLANVFMIPYNLKVWAHPLEMMSTQWVGERVAVPSLEAITEARRTMSDLVDWGPNSTFRFPLRGGTGSIWAALANELGAERLHLGDGVVRIDAQAHKAFLQSGLEIFYKHMITTVPLDCLTALTGVESLRRASSTLLHSTTHVVGIGLAGSPPPHLQHKSWMYFPEPDCPFYRVTVFSNYSPNNTPSSGTWSLMAEVSESRYKPVDRGKVVASVLEGMHATGLISPDARPLSRWHAMLDYGYPIPTIGRDHVLGEVMSALEKENIYSRGRFGAWKYEVSNQDHSFMQGWECVDRICEDLGPETEATLRTPDEVNSMKRPSALCL